VPMSSTLEYRDKKVTVCPPQAQPGRAASVRPGPHYSTCTSLYTYTQTIGRRRTESCIVRLQEYFTSDFYRRSYEVQRAGNNRQSASWQRPYLLWQDADGRERLSSKQKRSNRYRTKFCAGSDSAHNESERRSTTKIRLIEWSSLERHFPG
jgi:hypothetical protein